eukprot:scaffold647901_cov35-Prasinocladus_malaysianus.AAC.1
MGIGAKWFHDYSTLDTSRCSTMQQLTCMQHLEDSETINLPNGDNMSHQSSMMSIGTELP